MLIRTLRLGEILSFRWLTTVELNQLNILIGPNGVGKSNLIECIALLQALPNSLSSFLTKGGGPDNWVRNKLGRTGGLLNCKFRTDQYELQYQLGFSGVNNSLIIDLEDLDLFKNGEKASYFFRQANNLAYGS